VTIGIVGLGLIGGSFARALADYSTHTVFACDKAESAFLAAKMLGVVAEELTDDTLARCDLVLLALAPGAAVDYVARRAARFAPGALLVDCCGVKRGVQARLAPLARANGFLFTGGHPMAGTQFSGFKHARSTLFKGASMILCPDEPADIKALATLKRFFLELAFGEVVFVSPEEHDRRVAYTSQLPHVLSSAFIKSPTAAMHKGFSAGSYKDMTRVARLNEDMWTELFLANRDNLGREIDGLVAALTAYAQALKAGDGETLRQLLKDGREQKERIERSEKPDYHY
jgi:prephenate dehydrogenase